MAALSLPVALAALRQRLPFNNSQIRFAGVFPAALWHSLANMLDFYFCYGISSDAINFVMFVTQSPRVHGTGSFSTMTYRTQTLQNVMFSARFACTSHELALLKTRKIGLHRNSQKASSVGIFVIRRISNIMPA